MTSIEDRDYYYKSIEELDTEIFYLGPNDANMCKSDLIFGDMSVHVYIDMIYKYLRDEGYDAFALVGSPNEYNLYIIFIIK